jgi:hypothetical protein
VQRDSKTRKLQGFAGFFMSIEIGRCSIAALFMQLGCRIEVDFPRNDQPDAGNAELQRLLFTHY